MTYYTYILNCADDTFYTGITTDVERRESEHNCNDKLGAKYTKYRRPVKVVYKKSFEGRSEAMREEARIKKLSRTQKENLILKDD